MRIILNAECLEGPLTGIGMYIRHLIEELHNMPDVDDLQCYFQGELVPGAICLARADSMHHDRTTQKDKRIAFWNRVSDYTSLPYRLHKFNNSFRFKRSTRTLARAAVYHEPNYILKPYAGASVVTVHDLSVLHYPQFHPKARVKHVGDNLGRSLARAARVVTDSEFIRAELLARFEIEPARVRTCHLGVSDAFRPCAPEEMETILQPYSLRRGEYLLSVGTQEPRKNVHRLVAAFAALPDHTRRAYPLVLAGSRGWGAGDLAARLKPLIERGEAHTLGYVPRAHLPALYAGAAVFAFPSLYEGFGLPVLEAMACGTPVVTSDSSSLAEVAGDAAVLVDPADPGALGAALAKMLEDEALRKNLGRAGLERARHFSWRQCARDHVEVYRGALSA